MQVFTQQNSLSRKEEQLPFITFSQHLIALFTQEKIKDNDVMSRVVISKPKLR
ncbi:hypothetical protein A343_2352 [Porphyromonas gingivalis JCVI SC001]|nr:hypothetical protein A343_2352 [Porphyromonas gingivalis JCVI SC001]